MTSMAGSTSRATTNRAATTSSIMPLIIGMTAQTADVNITATAMRKLTLIHAVVSFFFNTVLVAAAVNVAVSLAAN